MAAPPSKLLLPVKMTESGRPELQQNEVECNILEGVDMEFEGPDHHVLDAQTLKGGIVHLTTHRLLWIDERSLSLHGSSGRRAFGLPFAAVTSMQPPRTALTRLFASPRLRFTVWTLSDGSISASGPSRNATSKDTVILVFRGPTSYDMFVSRLQEVLQAKIWLADVPAQRGSTVAGPSGGPSSADPPPREFTVSSAGVAGILRREEENALRTDKNLQVAFSDLNALMGKAKEMVQLAEKMRARLNPGEGEEGMGSKEDMQNLIQSVGIISPVTKESAGALYDQQLSRQLADFLTNTKLLERNGGMVALVDVYCIFNRARGTELISPQDLVQACELWEKIDVPARLRRFGSGVVAIQSSTRSDAEIMAKVAELARAPDAERSGMSASDAARALGIAPALAKEELLTAETRGYLCRDDGPDGLRFYRNFFADPISYTFVA